MAGRAKFILIALISLFGIDLHAQGIPYQLNPPAPNASVQFCPVPDGGYPCPVLTKVYSDSAATQVISQPIPVGPSGNLSVYFASGTSSVTVQLLGQGYGPQNRFVTGIGGGSGIPGQFSVKTYGAVGDTHASRNCTTATSSTTVTSTDNPWTASDVGKFFESVSPGVGADTFTPARKIAGFVNAGQITIDQVPDGTTAPGAGQFCKWFTKDDTAAFQAAVAAAKASSTARQPRNGSPTLAYPNEVYCPPGGYTVSGTIFMDNPANTSLGLTLFGAHGGSHCVIYPTATFVGTVDSVCSGVAEGLIYTCQTERTDVENIYIEGHAILFPSSSVAAGQGWVMLRNCTFCNFKNNVMTEIGLTSGVAILYIYSSSGVFENNFIQNGGGTGGVEAACRIEISTSLLFSNNTCSNHNQSMVIIGSGNRGSGSGQLTLLNELTDECGSGQVCTAISSGSVVNYVGGTSFGGVPELMSIDATSRVYFANHNIQAFGTPTGAIPTIAIASGGYLESTGSTLASNGTAVIVSGPIGATFVDAGGNQFLNCNTGTCAAITAANFSTQGFSGGIIPKATVTHTPNTCYAASGTLVQSQNLCNFLNDQNYQVLNITAQSGGAAPAASSCTVAPVITLSDGTRTATLTLTTGKTSWSSAVDASTVGSVFATGTTLTISAGTFTCATPPTNLSVSYVLQSVLNP